MTRREGSRRTSPSCRSCFGRTSRFSPTLAPPRRPCLHTDSRKPRRPTRSECNNRRYVPTAPGQLSRHRTSDTHSLILYSRIRFPPLPFFSTQDRYKTITAAFPNPSIGAADCCVCQSCRSFCAGQKIRKSGSMCS